MRVPQLLARSVCPCISQCVVIAWSCAHPCLSVSVWSTCHSLSQLPAACASACLHLVCLSLCGLFCLCYVAPCVCPSLHPSVRVSVERSVFCLRAVCQLVCLLAVVCACFSGEPVTHVRWFNMCTCAHIVSFSLQHSWFGLLLGCSLMGSFIFLVFCPHLWCARVCLSVCLLVCLSVWLFVCLSV